MKKVSYILFWMCLLPMFALAQSAVNMPAGDGGQQLRNVTDAVIFYDAGGETGNAPTYQISRITFVPRAGERIKVVFERINLTGGAVLVLFDGEKVLEESYDNLDDETTYSIPYGGRKKVLSSDTAEEFVSTSADGKLTVCYQNSNGGGTGWKATVTSEPKNGGGTPAVSDIIYMPSAKDVHERINITDSRNFRAPQERLTGFQKSGITFVPRNGEVIRIDFTDIALNEGSYSRTLLSFLDGDKSLDSGSEDIRISLSGTKNGFSIYSTSADGKLTAKLYPSYNGSASWNATVSSVPRPAVMEQAATSSVLLSHTPAIYTVAGTTHFYDDGGSNGTISRDFKGQVTFKPATAGSKVKIDFQKLQLFYNPSAVAVGNQDVLKVYNGTQVDESKLLTTLTTEPQTVKSSSDDGALTVVLRSKSGSMPGNGFEAVVSEFVSSAMTYVDTDLSQFTTGTVASGDTNQPILRMNVKTQNDLSPLSVSKFTFNTNGTFAQLQKASLFYTGSSSDFSATNKVGEINISADGFEINLTSNQLLTEGNNYFWLAYDVANTALSDAVVDAGCTAIVLSGQERSITSAQPDGNRKVKNEFVSAVGNFVKTISGQWSYTHTRASAYSTKYKAEQGNQVVTFVPASPDKKIQIDFSAFDVYVASTSYGTKASFQIFSGRTATGTPLWQADATNKSTGPGKPIRSAADDGTLTIVFNANTTTSYYTGNGWQATVSEYAIRPMEVKTITAFQSNTEIVAPNTDNQEIAGVEIVVEGTEHPLSLQELTLNLKGTQSVVGEVKVFSTGESKAFDTNQLVASVSSPTQEEVVMTLSSPVVLTEGKNYLWIAYSVKPEATTGQVLDVALTAAKVNGEVKTITNGDPDGSRMVKNIYLFQNGENRVNVTVPLLFYDNGGADAPYTAAAKGSVTFVPRDGEAIKLIFREFNTAYTHKFTVLNGGISSTPIVEISGSKIASTMPEPILSSADDGSLTIMFSPSSSTTSPRGWEIEVQSVRPQELSVAKVKAENIAHPQVLRGEEVAMLKLAVEVVGDRGSINLTDFRFASAGTTTESDIASAKLYYTGTHNAFAPTQLVASASGSLQFTGDTRIDKAGTHYFWLTYNVSASAQPNHTLTAALTSVHTTAQLPAELIEGASASTTVRAGFSGTYTIGSTGHYSTFAQAIAAMQGGIDGKVVFEVENGTYNESVRIPHIKGASAKNTITIRSKSGNRSDVVMEVNSYSAPAYGEFKPGVFTINGADYLTIENLSVKTDKVQYPAVVLVDSVSRYVTLRNCVIEAPQATGVSDVSLVRIDGHDVANQNSDFFTIEHCSLNGGRIGVYVYGTGYVALPKQKGIRVRNNTFTLQGAMGIYLTKEHNALLENNTVKATGQTHRDFKGIDATLSGNTVIRGNRIYADETLSATDVKALFIRKSSDAVAEEGRNRICNNEVILHNVPANTQYGVYFSNEVSNTDVVYNSVNISNVATKANSATWYMTHRSSQPTSVVVKNNILQNNAGGYVYWLRANTYFANVTFACNGIYTSGTTFASAGSAFASFADWQASAGETSSVNEAARFLSESSLDLTSQATFVAQPFADVTTDINGNQRSATQPTMGAYEYAEAVMPEMHEHYPMVENITPQSATLRAKLTENGRLFTLLKKADEQLPTVQDLLGTEPKNLAKNVEQSILFTTLKANSQYKIYYLLQSLKGETSAVRSTETFTTRFVDTQVSTFEQVVQTDENSFTDGTARFQAFTITEMAGAESTSAKVATVQGGQTASIALTNTVEGLNLTGFFIKNASDVHLRGERQDGTFTNTLVISKFSDWQFVRLNNLGKVVKVHFEASQQPFSIDNFSGTPLPLIATLVAGKTQLQANETTTLVADVSGGVRPYVFEWTPTPDGQTGASIDIAPAYSTMYYLTVTDADGNKQELSQLVKVDVAPAELTFESFPLQNESYWKGNTDGTHHRYEGGFEFSQYVAYGGSYWGGISYSNKTNFSEAGGLNEQWTSATGAGADGSANYGVLYTMGTRTEIANLGTPTVLKGMRVTNNTYALTSMKNGDTFAKKFGGATGNDADWFKLTIKGFNGTTPTGSIDFYLADFRFADNSKDYIVEDWRFVDLTSLGEVTKVQFTLSSSDTGAYGMNTPAYVCIDNFNMADTTTGLTGNKAEQLHVKYLADKEISVNESGVLKVFATDGKQVYGDSRYQAHTAVSLQHLAAGVYVVTLNNHTARIVVK